MGTRALVVGGTGGIGYAMACRLAAEANSTVIISGRTKPASIPHSNMEFRSLDASSMRAIKQYAEQYKLSSSTPDQKLDMLVMTQGILTTAGRTETSEGIDRKMALHYYGRQLLIRELSPMLKDDAKVVVVLDGLRGSPAKLNWDDLDLKTHFTLRAAADHCISMNDAMIQYWAAQQGATTGRRHFIHAFPGMVSTNIFHGLPWYLRPLARVGSLIAVPPDTCAENLLKGVSEVAAEGEKNGRGWSCIDDKGKLVGEKPIWSEEEQKKVADHTWKTVDEASEK